MQRPPAARTHVSGAESGGAAAFPSNRGARQGLTWSFALTLTRSPHPAPCPLPAAGSQAQPRSFAARCPRGALATCRALATRGALNVGVLLPARGPHPRTCRPAPPLPALPAPRCPPPHPESSLSPSPPPAPTPPLLPPPRPLAAPRGPGSHPSRCFPLRAGLFVEVTCRHRSPPTEETPSGWGRDAGAAPPWTVVRPLLGRSGEKHQCVARWLHCLFTP